MADTSSGGPRPPAPTWEPVRAPGEPRDAAPAADPTPPDDPAPTDSPGPTPHDEDPVAHGTEAEEVRADTPDELPTADEPGATDAGSPPEGAEPQPRTGQDHPTPHGVAAPPGTGPSVRDRAQVGSDPRATPTRPSSRPESRPRGHAHADERPAPRWRRRLAVGALALLLVLTSIATVHLFRTTTAWQDRAEAYLETSRELGEDLAATRAELAGAQAELDAVRGQLGTAQERIVELADEKAQLGDDREAQRQLVDYQERVTDAAGRVALALDQCVQGQQQLIGYLENADAYDPEDLEAFGDEVETLCQRATEANISLQRELDR